MRKWADGKKKREKFVDDGRTIADMNVEGMPWHTPKSDPEAQAEGEPIELTAAEKRAMTFGVLKAVLLISVVFLGTFALFILFCVYIWFA